MNAWFTILCGLKVTSVSCSKMTIHSFGWDVFGARVELVVGREGLAGVNFVEVLTGVRLDAIYYITIILHFNCFVLRYTSFSLLEEVLDFLFNFIEVWLHDLVLLHLLNHAMILSRITSLPHELLMPIILLLWPLEHKFFLPISPVTIVLTIV